MTGIRDPETGEVLQPESPSGSQRLRDLRDKAARIAKAKREKRDEPLEAERWERYKQSVRRQEQERADQARTDAETLAQLSPVELAAHYAKHPPDPLERPPNLLSGT